MPNPWEQYATPKQNPWDAYSKESEVQATPTTPVEEKGTLQSIYDTIAPHFARGVERTAERVPQIARDVVGGSLSGLVDVGKTIASVPSPLDIAGVTEAPDSPKVLDRLSGVAQDIAHDPTSPEFGVAELIAPTPPVGKVAKVAKTTFGKMIDNLPHDAKVRAELALDKIDEIGGIDLSVGTRGKILDNLDLTKSSDEVSAATHNALNEAKIGSYNIQKAAYTKADEIAVNTNTVDTKNTVDALGRNTDGRGGIPTKDMKKRRKVYREIKATLEDNSIVNAKGIEDKLKILKEEQREAKDSLSYLYSRAIDDLEVQQKNLLGANNSEVYAEARELWKNYKREFEGKIDGTGVTGGKAINSVMVARDNYGISEKLLGKDFNPNLAQQVGKNFTSQEKRDMAFSVLTRGIDKKLALNTPDNVEIFISNFENANSDGLRIMLGDKGYESARASVEALDFVQEAIHLADKTDRGIAKNAINFIGAAAAAKISPYAAVHVAINESRNMANKVMFNKSYNTLIKRTKDIKNVEVRRRILKALRIVRTMQPVGVAVQGAREEE